MRASYILLLIVAVKATKFLDEPAILLEDEEKPYMQYTVFAQSSSLFTEEELSKNSEPAKQYTSEFNYEDENQSSLNTADQSQIFLAAQYEKDLPATGDCVVLYSACDFKGTSGKVCKAEDAMNFQIPAFSIYVPIGQQFTTLDSSKNEQVAFLTSEKCLTEPLVMLDTQKDVFIAKTPTQLATSDNQSNDETMVAQQQFTSELQDQSNELQVQSDQQPNLDQVQQVQEQEQISQTQQLQEQLQQEQQSVQQSETPQIQQSETQSQEIQQQVSVDDVSQTAEALVGQTQ